MNNNNSFVEIKNGKHSDIKESVAIVIEDYLKSNAKFYSDGYRDFNSKFLVEYLNGIFLDYDFKKNSSQSVFDIYSIKGKIAIELKSSNVRKNKDGEYSINRSIITNASVFPKEINIKNVVSKKYLNADTDFNMDVLVVCVDKFEEKVIRYCIVDGYWWDIDIEEFVDCRNLFNQMNEIKDDILKMIVDKYDNKFVKKYMETDDITIDFRKLITISNPLYRKCNHV